jgi:hypothetical protein
MENGGNIKGWGAHGGGASSVRFTHDGRVASCGRDRVAKTWDQNGALQKQFDAFNDLALRVTFNHDGSRVIAGDWTGDVRVWSAADGKLLGNLTANPPTLAERIESGAKELAARRSARQQLEMAAAQSKMAADRAAGDLANAQKLASDKGVAAKAAQDNAARAKAAADKANSDVTVAQAIAAGKQAAAKAVAEIAAQADEMAKKAPENAGLADGAARTKQRATQAAGEAAEAQKMLADLMVLAKTNADQFAASSAAVEKANADVAATAKQVEAVAAAAKAAADTAATDAAAVNQAAASVAALEASLAKWVAARSK